MATAIELITRAYQLFGYIAKGETPDADDVALGLRTLNGMIDGRNTQSYYIPTVNELVQVVSGNPITIGRGMTIDIERPTIIHNGSFVRVSGVDYPIHWIDREQYNQIAVKAIQSPIAIYGYYDQNVPTANIFLWPFPTTTAELHLQIPGILSKFADLTTDYFLAPSYQESIEFTLAGRLAHGIREISPRLEHDIKAANRVLRRSNVDVPMLNIGGSVSSPYANFIAGN